MSKVLPPAFLLSPCSLFLFTPSCLCEFALTKNGTSVWLGWVHVYFFVARLAVLAHKKSELVKGVERLLVRLQTNRCEMGTDLACWHCCILYCLHVKICWKLPGFRSFQLWLNPWTEFYLVGKINSSFYGLRSHFTTSRPHKLRKTLVGFYSMGQDHTGRMVVFMVCF